MILGPQGIDVSYHQEEIDWAAVAASGLVNYAYIRVGTGDGTGGWLDPRFAENYEGAKAVGIPCGPYHAFETSCDPTMQFAFFSDTVQDCFFELPVWLDVEREREVSYALARTRWVDYLQMFDDWGRRKSTIYTSKWKWQQVIQGWWFDILKQHLIDGHPLAVADYNPLPTPRLPSSWTDWMFWQTNIAEPGVIPGITTQVDIDYFNGTAEEFLAFQNLPQQATLEERVARIETGLRKYHPDFFGG